MGQARWGSHSAMHRSISDSKVGLSVSASSGAAPARGSAAASAAAAVDAAMMPQQRLAQGAAVAARAPGRSALPAKQQPAAQLPVFSPAATDAGTAEAQQACRGRHCSSDGLRPWADRWMLVAWHWPQL